MAAKKASTALIYFFAATTSAVALLNPFQASAQDGCLNELRADVLDLKDDYLGSIESTLRGPGFSRADKIKAGPAILTVETACGTAFEVAQSKLDFVKGCLNGMKNTDELFTSDDDLLDNDRWEDLSQRWRDYAYDRRCTSGDEGYRRERRDTYEPPRSRRNRGGGLFRQERPAETRRRQPRREKNKSPGDRRAVSAFDWSTRIYPPALRTVMSQMRRTCDNLTDGPHTARCLKDNMQAVLTISDHITPRLDEAGYSGAAKKIDADCLIPLTQPVRGSLSANINIYAGPDGKVGTCLSTMHTENYRRPFRPERTDVRRYDKILRADPDHRLVAPDGVDIYIRAMLEVHEYGQTLKALKPGGPAFKFQ